MDPGQTAPSLIWVHTACNKNDFESYRQKTKQTTINVVFGILRVKTLTQTQTFLFQPNPIDIFLILQKKKPQKTRFGYP